MSAEDSRPSEPRFRAVAIPGYTVDVKWQIERRRWFGWQRTCSFAYSPETAQAKVDFMENATRSPIYPTVKK